MPQKVHCNACKQDVTLARIVYGLPGNELAEKAKRKEVVLGGCFMPIEKSPLYACKECGAAMPEQGTYGDYWSAARNKTTARAFIEKEKRLLGESNKENYLKERGLL
jgi:hypothetical protein